MSSVPDNPNVLIVEFTQTGATSEIAGAFAGSLQQQGVTITREAVQPVVPYPFPWKSIGRFFDVMPECILGRAPEIQPPQFPTDTDYDVVVMFYQVWFLSPSLPILGFLQHPSADVLRGRKVITVVVSRNMWATASQKMRALLKDRGAHHCDNVSVTHQGPIWATFITIPRLLLWGKNDRLWNIFPPPGIGQSQVERLSALGDELGSQLTTGSGMDDSSPFFRGMNATHVEERYLLPEFIGVHIFEFWAAVISKLGQLGGKWLRRLGVYCFVFTLVTLIVFGIPILLVTKILFYPFLKAWLQQQAARLREPSDSLVQASTAKPATIP